jgi:hypothetical protein
MENEIIEQNVPEVEPHGTEQGAPAAETDWKAEARKWEARAKANNAANDELEALKTQSAAELAEAVKRAEQAEAKAAQLEAAAARERAVNAIAAETGVSAAVLGRMQGETEDEIRANAQVVRSTMPVYPTTQEMGNGNAPTVTRESILQIKNERERLKAIAEHADLF